MKKRVFIVILLAIFSSSLFAGTQNKDNIEAIKKVITAAYVDGILNLGNISDIENGFHPGFILFYERDNHLNEFPIYTWIEIVKQRKKENPNGPEEKSTIKFLMVDSTGNTGIAKFEIYRGSKLIYTDCFMLLKFQEGWKIVAKISHHHE
jgi:hypothetical protein